MKSNVIIELINRGIIDLDNKVELKKFLSLKDSDVKILLDINEPEVINLFKEYILSKLTFNGYNTNLNVEKVQYILCEVSKIEKKELIPDIVKFLDKLSYGNALWNALEGKVNLINNKAKIKLLEVAQIHLQRFYTDWEKFVSNILKQDDKNVLNIYISIMTAQLLNESKFYDEVVTSIIEIRDYSILCVLNELVIDENMLSSNDFIYVFRKAISYKDDKLLDFFVSIACNENLLTNDNYKRIIDMIYSIKIPQILEVIDNIVYEEVLTIEELEKAVRVLVSNNINPLILPSFEKLVLTEGFMSINGSVEILKIMCKITDSSLGDIFMDIVTNNDLMYDNRIVDIAELASQFHNGYSLSFFRDLLEDEDLVSDYKLFTVLRKVLDNQERSYSSNFFNILTDPDFLESEVYFPSINILFKTYDERKIYLLSEFLTSDYYDTDLYVIDKFLELAFSIEESNLLSDFLNIIKNDDIKYSDKFGDILDHAIKISNPSILRKYIELITFMFDSEDYVKEEDAKPVLSFLPFRKSKENSINNFDYVLYYASNIKDEKMFSYMASIVVDADISKTDYLQFILDRFSNVSLNCVSSFVQIILNPLIIQFDNYEKIVLELSKVNDSEKMKILEDISNTNMINIMFENLIHIDNIKLLKDISLLFNDLNVPNNNIDKDKVIRFLNTFINYYDDERSDITKNIIRSSNPIISNNKSILYEMLFENRDINDNSLKRKGISSSDINVIMREINDTTLMYKQIEFKSLLDVATKEDIINSLMDMEEDEEVSVNTLVKKIK